MNVYNSHTMPLSNDERLRIVQEKIIRGDNLTLTDKMIAGRDHPVKVINGYELKSDHAYRVVSEKMFEI